MRRKGIVMANEEIFEATKKVYGLYGAFFKVVADELGAEKALEMHAKAHEDQGLIAGKMLKDKFSDESPDLQKLGTILKESNLSIGIDCNLDQSTDSLLSFKNYRCPMYDGYRAGGLDDDTAEALCQEGATAKLGTMLRHLNPRLEYKLTSYRSKPDEACIENISMV
jgi:hypothetical protein